MRKPLICCVYIKGCRGFILLMFVYRTFDTSDMKNKLLKCNLMYWFKLFFTSFNTFDMGQLVLYYIIFIQPCKIACSIDLLHLQHTLYLAKLFHNFFRIPIFGRKVFLIFLTIDLGSDLQLICILAYLT